MVAGATATCPASGLNVIEVELRKQDDSGTVQGPVPAIVDGGSGADTIEGSDAGDVIRGSAGNDSIDGNGGPDFALAGTGNDSFAWDPGDGSDALEGQEHRDTLRFDGDDGDEAVDLTANGSRLRLARDVGGVVMDVDGVETVEHRAFGGADTTTIGDLAATAVTSTSHDLGATGGGGDGQADRVIVNGTGGDDVARVAASGGGLRVTGLAARTTVAQPGPGDGLTVNGLGGDDELHASPDVATLAAVLLDGGADTDTVHARGTNAADDLTATANGYPGRGLGRRGHGVQPHLRRASRSTPSVASTASSPPATSRRSPPSRSTPATAPTRSAAATAAI